MTGNDKKQLENWAWFALKNGCLILLLYQWICRHEDGALNLLLVVFWLLSTLKLLFLFGKIEAATGYSKTRRALYSMLYFTYGSLMVYYGAVMTGAVMIVSELFFAAKCKLIQEEGCRETVEDKK